jgi:AraC-like DNA-binding protein
MTGKNQFHYHPVDDHASEWGFYLTTTGRILEPITTQLPYGAHPDMYMFDVSPVRADAVRTRSPRECGRILPEFTVTYITEGSNENSGRSMHEEKHGEDNLAARMLDLIWTGSHRGMSTEQMCQLLGANRRTVERKFREARGHSLLTEVNLCRCRRARHLLEKTDLPIKNICWLAGFSNIEQMRMNFLQHLGTTPSQYRQAHR